MSLRISPMESSVKARLVDLVPEYLAGKLSSKALVEEVRKLESQWPRGEDCYYQFQLLLKRLERSCKRHFCSLWRECRAGCQYDDGPGWEEDVKIFRQLRPSSPSTVKGDVGIAAMGLVPESGDAAGEGAANPRRTSRTQRSDGMVACEVDADLRAQEDKLKRFKALAAVQRHLARCSLDPRTAGSALPKQREVPTGTRTTSSSRPAASAASGTSPPTVGAGGAGVPGPAGGTGGVSATSRAAGTLLVQEADSAFDAVPVIDLMGLDFKTLDAEMAVARRVGKACAQVGFLYVVNHGVPKSLAADAFRWSARFFALKRDAKMELDAGESAGGIRGYFALGKENLNVEPGEITAHHRGDVKESFDIGRPPTVTDAAADAAAAAAGGAGVAAAAAADPDAGRPLFGANQWPDETKYSSIAGFREFVERYYRAMTHLGRRMMRLFALSLGLPGDYFARALARPASTLRFLHYPPQPAAAASERNRLSCGAHTDYGCCTILAQDSTGGLQLRNSHHQWVHAPPVDGSFVINLGDMMNRWTNGVYRSTVHRVRNMKELHRYSIPFFFNPSLDAPITCLPTCERDGEPPRFAGSTCEAILMKRYAETLKPGALEPGVVDGTAAKMVASAAADDSGGAV